MFLRFAYGAASLVLLLSGCARDNPMFEQDTDGAGSSDGGTGKGDSNSNSNSNGDGGDDGTDSAATDDAAGDHDTGAVSDTGDTGDGTTGDETTTAETGTEMACEKVGDTFIATLLDDTFVATDSGPYCGGNLCQTRNFGQTPMREVLDSPAGDGYITYLLTRFDLSQVPFDTILEADLVLTIGGPKGLEIPPFEVAAYLILDSDWVEGNGVGEGGSLAAKGESSWTYSANPTEWTGGDAFPAALGPAIGSLSVGKVAGGEQFAVKLPPPSIAVDGLGHIGIAVTKTDGIAGLPLFTSDAFEGAVTLTLQGCNSDG